MTPKERAERIVDEYSIDGVIYNAYNNDTKDLLISDIAAAIEETRETLKIRWPINETDKENDLAFECMPKVEWDYESDKINLHVESTIGDRKREIDIKNIDSVNELVEILNSIE